MWKKMLDAMRFLGGGEKTADTAAEAGPVDGPEESQPPTQPSPSVPEAPARPAPIEAAGSDGEPDAFPDLPPVGLPVEEVLERVLEEPEAVDELGRDGLEALPGLTKRAMSPIRGDRVLAIAYAWAMRGDAAAIPDDVLAVAVWSGDKWQRFPQRTRVQELLRQLPFERAEKVLLRGTDPDDPVASAKLAGNRALLSFFEGAPSLRLARVLARNAHRDMRVLQACGGWFEPAIWDELATLAADEPELAAPNARWFLIEVTDASEERWEPLWKRAVGRSFSYNKPEFWRRFEALEPERREAIALSGPLDPQVASRTPSVAVAERLVEALAPQKKPDPKLANALGTQGEHALEPILTALKSDCPARSTLLEALTRLDDPRGHRVLLDALLHGKKAEREVAQRGLQHASFANLEAALREGLADRRKTVRRAAIAFLRERGDAPSLALAAQVAGAEKAKDLRQELEALGAVEAAPELGADLEAAITAVVDPKAHRDLVDPPEPQRSFGTDPTGTLARLVALAPLAATWTYNGLHLELPKLLEAWQRLPLDAEGVRYALARSVVSAGYGCTRQLLELAPTDQAFVELLDLAARRHPPANWRSVLLWVEQHAPDRLEGFCRTALQNPGSYRDAVDPFLLALGERALPLLEVQLSAKQAPDRRHAAGLLAEMRVPAALALLQARLPRERSKAVRQVLLGAMRPGLLAGLADATPQACDAALASWPAPPLPGWVELDRLDLAWEDGTALSEGALAWLVGSLASATGVEPPLIGLCRRLDPVRAAASYTTLRTLHDPQAHGADTRWVLLAAACLGDAAQRDALARQCDSWFRGGRHTHASTVLDVLVGVGDADSIRWLDHWARKARSTGLVENAQERLGALAEARGSSVAVLMESVIPDLGFGPDGTRALSSGDRTFTLRLTVEGLAIEHQGKAFSSLPRARKGEDTDAVAAARDELSALNQDVRRYQQLAATLFEEAMVLGRTWSRERWLALVGNPIVRPVAARVVFESTAGRFRWSDCTAFGAEGVAVGLAEQLGVAHPVDGELFAFEDVIEEQPFPQIDRPAFEASDLDGLIDSRTRIPCGTLQDLLGRRGYHRGEVLDGGWVTTLERALGGYRVVLHHSGFPVGDGTEPVTLQRLQVLEVAHRSVEPGRLPARLASEIGADLASLP